MGLPSPNDRTPSVLVIHKEGDFAFLFLLDRHLRRGVRTPDRRILTGKWVESIKPIVPRGRCSLRNCCSDAFAWLSPAQAGLRSCVGLEVVMRWTALGLLMLVGV